MMTIAQIIDLIADMGYPITVAAHLPNKKAPAALER